MSLFYISSSRFLSSSLIRRQRLWLNPRFLSSNSYNNDLLQVEKQQTNEKRSPRIRRYHYYLISIATGALIGTIYALRQVRKHEGVLPEYVTNAEVLERKAMENRPTPVPVTKRIRFDSSPRIPFPYKLTLYQYVTCPFCCKVRAFLNYNRIPYDIVEVNSVTHAETRWSLYNKVPIVVVENERIQLNDSSEIISAIESYLRHPTKSFKDVVKLYRSIVEKDRKGNLFFNYPDRFDIVQPLIDDLVKNDETLAKKIDETRGFFARFFSRSKPVPIQNVVEPKIEPISKENDQFERQWRQWVDDKFIHVLSPNIYCTIRQSINTFQWFSRAGDWEEIFPWYQRWIIVYLGAIVMRAVANRLKKKYNLNDDVRVSLYECGDEWAEAVGDKDFLGGSQPNVADLNVYGILTAIEGCQAFDDLMNHSKIRGWFDRMKALVEPHRLST